MSLWAVGSALWLVFVVWTMPAENRIDDLWRSTVFSYRGETLRLPPRLSHDAAQVELTRWAEQNQGHLGLHPVLNRAMAPHEAVDEMLLSYRPRSTWEIVEPWLLRIVLPPLAVAAIGAAVLWTARGARLPTKSN